MYWDWLRGLLVLPSVSFAGGTTQPCAYSAITVADNEFRQGAATSLLVLGLALWTCPAALLVSSFGLDMSVVAHGVGNTPILITANGFEGEVHIHYPKDFPFSGA